MSRKNWGFVLAGVGVLLILLGVFADSIGIGGTPGFGFVQIAALVLGFVLLIVGLYLAFGPQPSGDACRRDRHGGGCCAKVALFLLPPTQKDDLTRLEGIGPKLQDVLYSMGFTTFSALASATPDAITRALKDSGVKVPFDASSWPQQASWQRRATGRPSKRCKPHSLAGAKRHRIIDSQNRR
jgi:hypothetical protein